MSSELIFSSAEQRSHKRRQQCCTWTCRSANCTKAVRRYVFRVEQLDIEKNLLRNFPSRGSCFSTTLCCSPSRSVQSIPRPPPPTNFARRGCSLDWPARPVHATASFGIDAEFGGRTGQPNVDRDDPVLSVDRSGLQHEHVPRELTFSIVHVAIPRSAPLPFNPCTTRSASGSQRCKRVSLLR